MQNSTDGLLHILADTTPENLGAVLESNRADLFDTPLPFAQYIRELLRLHGKTQNHVLEKAGFDLHYGYRLLSEERHTKQRDYILRICFAAEFTLDEIQRLLKLYGMSPLYPRIPRDAVLITAVTSGITDPEQVDTLLIRNGFSGLRKCNE